MRFQVGDRSANVLDIESQVMSAHIAVAWRCRTCALKFVLEYLEARASLAPKHAKLSDDCAGIDAKVHLHPVVSRLERSDFEYERTANHIDEEPRRRLDVGHGEPHMIRARQSWQAAAHRFDTGSQIMVISRSFCSSKILSLTSANFCR